MISRSCFGKHVRKRFLPILGRSVRADLIGRQFWANPADFGKNRRFPGFGLVDGRDIARAREDFCRSLVDVQIKTSHRSPCVWFLEKSVDFPVSVRSGPLGSSYETGSDRSTNRTKNRQESPQI